MTSPADRDDVALIILGATGDLTSRLLLPGLAGALAAHDLPRVTLVGSSHSEHSTDEWRSIVREGLAGAALDEDEVEDLVARAAWHTADATDADDLRALFETAREAAGPDAAPVLYFALGPGITREAVGALAGLEDLPDGLRLALEKPFGEDEESARELNAVLADVVEEDRVFRVDHFLGESMVTALLGLRTANRLLGRVWGGRDVERVDVVVDETIALEGRAEFYDGTGALKDMVQSHLLQVLAMAALEPPERLRPQELHDAVVEVLRATRVWQDDPVAASRRARYTAGEVDGERIPAYAEEEGVDPGLRTETLAEVSLVVDTERWRGVPFRLRSGKALGRKRWEVALTLRAPEDVPEGLSPAEGRDRIVVGLDPREVRIELAVDGADTPFDAERRTLAADLGEEQVDAYGEVLRGILTGQTLLSVRGDAAEECWRILAPVLAAWEAEEVPLDEYPAGSAGPAGWG